MGGHVRLGYTGLQCWTEALMRAGEQKAVESQHMAEWQAARRSAEMPCCHRVSPFECCPNTSKVSSALFPSEVYKLSSLQTILCGCFRWVLKTQSPVCSGATLQIPFIFSQDQGSATASLAKIFLTSTTVQCALIRLFVLQSWLHFSSTGNYFIHLCIYV